MADDSWIEPIVEGHLYDVKLFNWGYTLKASLYQIGDAFKVVFIEPVRGQLHQVNTWRFTKVIMYLAGVS